MALLLPFFPKARHNFKFESHEVFHLVYQLVIVGQGIKDLNFFSEVQGSIPCLKLSCLLANHIGKLSSAQLYRFQRGNRTVSVLVVWDTCQVLTYLLAEAHVLCHLYDRPIGWASLNEWQEMCKQAACVSPLVNSWLRHDMDNDIIFCDQMTA